MAVISANGTVFLIQSPLLMNNQVLTFPSREKQVSYFGNLPKMTLQDTSFVDGADGTYISVRGNVDEIRKYNYVMYRNENYGNRWFYAFITKMSYGGINTAKVYLKQDCFQTWQFDLNYKPCFVEREHTSNDEIGSNLLDENLETGDYVNMGEEMLMDFTQTCILLMMANQIGNTRYINGIYSALQFVYFENNANGWSAMESFINDNAEISDKIMGAVVYPTKYLIGKPSNGQALVNSESAFQSSVSVSMNTILDGYKPKNKKLLTYPYNYLQVYNGNGDSNDFKYEYFSSNNPTFKTYATISQKPIICVTPISYRKATRCDNEMVSYSDFPLCSWLTNDFQVWFSQNQTSQVLSMLTSTIGFIGNSVVGNFNGAMTSGVQLASTIGGYDDMKRRGNSFHGSMDSNLAYITNNCGIKAIKYCIDGKHAKMLDDYLTRYGYKTCELKLPNITGRKNWNYVKTIDSCITCNVCPSTDLEEINNMFNQGITLWHGDKSSNNVFNYSLDNSIV